jgi:putative transposase
MTSPARRREVVDQVHDAFGISERRACRALEQPRSSQRYLGQPSVDQEPVAKRVVELAVQFGRYGYRRITALLKIEGWAINHKRVERIWRREGLKVPARQPKRGRLWLNAGSSVRLRPTHRNHVWNYDFVMDATHDRRSFRMLNVIDEYTRECLMIKVARRLTSEDVQECLTELFCSRGVPEHIRSDNGSEFAAEKIRGCWRRSTPGRCSLSPAVRGKTATSRASTASSGMNC